MKGHWDTRYDFNGRKRKAKKPTGEVFTKYKPKPVFTSSPVSPQPYRRDAGVTYRSADDVTHIAARSEPQKYTGTLVKGIATMHKSNAVPIIDDQQATEISQMRRN